MKNKYQIWIKQWNTTIRFPVLPESIDFTLGQNNETISLDRIGETTIIQPAGPIETSLSLQLPAKWFPMCSFENFLSPTEIIKRLENMKHTGTVRFILTNTIINLEMTIENLEVEERAGDVGTLYIDLDLKQFMQPTQRRVLVVGNKIKIPGELGKARADNRTQLETYTVKEGDYLLKISKEILGNTSAWTDILALNTNILNNNPNNLTPGMILKMPEKKFEVSGRA